MSTIADFFTVSSAPSGLKTPRVTHGTTCYRYTYGCCNSCCLCIPTGNGTQKWAYEMWGQGGGGGQNCCCYYSPRGGGGGEYGAARQSRDTGTPLAVCMCACMCWCCCYGGTCGHPGQFSRICEGNYIGWTMSTGGGYAGWGCCNYLWSYPNDCNLNYAVLAFPFMTAAFGGGGSTPLCRMQDLVPSSQNDGNSQQSLGDPIVCLPIIATQAAPTATSSGGLPGASTSPYYYFQCAQNCCQCGTHTAAIYNCSVTERLYFNGSCGYANGSLGVAGVQGNNYLGIGIGGASYAGGNAQPYHSCSNSWTWGGCMGNVPGGGGSSSGGCAGDCCYGSIGGAGLVIVSYDN